MSIPWSQMELYLALHQDVMEPLVAMRKQENMNDEIITSSLPLSFLKMHELITKILKQTNVLKDDEEAADSKTEI